MILWTEMIGWLMEKFLDRVEDAWRWMRGKEAKKEANKEDQAEEKEA